MTTEHKNFDTQERDAVYRAIQERRDMRHFVAKPVELAQLQRILEAAHHAPSVGHMQPWRMIRVTDQSLRKAIKAIVEQERQETAKALGERQDEFLQLKVEGIEHCGELLVVSLMDKREQHVFGRRTLPEMDLASVACAIQNMWLAARAENLGMGWVSLFDVKALADLLNIPQGGKPVAILCLGHVDEFYPAPMLELENWRQGCNLEDILYENQWESAAKP